MQDSQLAHGATAIEQNPTGLGVDEARVLLGHLRDHRLEGLIDGFADALLCTLVQALDVEHDAAHQSDLDEQVERDDESNDSRNGGQTVLESAHGTHRGTEVC